MTHNAPVSPWFTATLRNGDTVTVRGMAITPQSRVLLLRLPFATLVWHRPVAALVRRDGHTARVPIRDTTRLAQGALFGVALLVLCGLLVSHGERNEHDG